LLRVFVDAVHYIALLLANDDLHDEAARADRSLGGASFVTIDPVFTEVLAHVARLGPVARTSAIAMIDALRADTSVTIVRQTPELAGLNLYRRRPDKGYSLTDCMSMVVCQQYDITDALTHDRHFEQEGFTILL
jgi:predicted nucleic acid-binding protein